MIITISKVSPTSFAICRFGNLPYPVMLSFTHVWRSKEFNGQDGADKFGAAQVSVQF